MNKIKTCVVRSTLLCACVAGALLLHLPASAQTLVNRYSFTDDGTHTNIVDSVGGVNWYGTLPNGGDLTDVPGQLILSASSQQYVQLPSGVLSNYTAVTIDAWATFSPTLPVNCWLYGFGATDAGGAGENYIFLQPHDGRIGISQTDPGWVGEMGCGGAGNLSGQTVHITSVYNPVAGYVELYTNGVLVSVNNNVTVPMTSISNQLNYIGRSLFNADAYMDVELNEFRIWNGVLNPIQVAGCDVAGPDTVGSAASAGTMTSIQLSVPLYQLIQGGSETLAVTAQLSAFASPVTITRLATYSSSNTNVLRINPTNYVISAVGQGSATIVATYGSVSSTQTITVVQPSSALTHRYSFSDTDNGSGNVGSSVADSVGGPAWNGTLPNGGALTGSQLQLSAASAQYVQLASGIISNYNAVTVEAWVTFPDALPGNCWLFGFGNTDAGGAGEQYVYLQPQAGHIGIGGNDPGWQGEQQAGTYGNLSTKTNIHVTAVFNTQANWIAVYTNGVLAGKNTATTWQLYNNVSDVLSYIGRSLFNGDAYMDFNLDEFRIYNGALTSQGIAISDAAGPNSIPAGVTNGPGTLLSLTIQAPTLQPFQSGSIKLLANYTSLTNWDIIGNSIFTPAGLTISVSDTNVITSNGGVLTGVRPGTALVITVYQGITNTALVTVTQALAPVLAHRYSFFSQPSSSLVATDSIAGFNGSLQGGSSIAGGQLVLDGTSGYLNLPAGVIANNGINYPTLTVETWVTFGTVPVNSWFWGFGNTDAGGAGEQYISCNPQSTRVNITDADPGWRNETECQTTGNWSGQNMHIVAVYNQPAGYEALYTNGVLAAEVALTIPMSSVSSALGYIGKSLYNGDPYTPCNVSEFRIYSGVMSPNDVAATQVLGPTNTLTANPTMNASLSGANLNLAWPVSAGSYSVQVTTNLASHVWTTVTSPTAQINGNQWQISVPNSGGARFYRLTR